MDSPIPTQSSNAESSICSIATVVVLVLTLLSPYVLVPKNSEFTGAAAVIILSLVGGGILSVILCIAAIYRKERLSWLAPVAIAAALLLILVTSR